MTTGRKIMRTFKMTEISAVDRPAQVHARMSIMKRDDGTSADHNEEELDMTEAEIAKKIADGVKTATADLTGQLEKANADIVALKSAVTKAETEKADLQKANDLAKSDEVLKVGDKEIRKSVVGVDMFEFAKAQSAEIAKANDARELVELTKRAETELSALPGEAVAKAAVLKSIAKLPEAERATLDTMLKSGEAALKLAMKSAGRDGNTGDSNTAEEKIDTLAKAYAKEHNVTIAKAYDAVVQTEEGAKLYADSKKAA